jgi:hypothetical protein
VIDQLLGVTAEALETGAVAETGIPMAEVPEPVDVPAPPTSFLPELHTAVASLDRCRTQNEILSSLVESAGSFASRAALFLTREDGLQGWSSQGFAEGDEAFESLVLEYDEGSPWGRLSKGRGVIELDATECADLCSRIDNSSPSSGVLVPIVLRDHLAVALYADQVEDDESVGLSALQLLAYVAAQALETLPIRERSSTATLRLATDAPVGEPVLTLWQFHAPEADVAIVEEIEEVVEPAIEEEAEDLYAAEAVEEVAAQDEAAEAVDFEEAEEIEVTFEEEAAEEEAEVEAVDFQEVEEEIEEAVDVEEAGEVEEALEEEAAEIEAAEIEAEMEAVDFQEVEEEIEEADEAVDFEEAEEADEAVEAVEAVDFEEAEEADEAVEAVDFEEAEAIEEAHEEEAEVEIAAETAFQPAEETGFEVEPAAEDEWAAPAEIEEETAEEEFVAPPPEPEVAPEPAPVAVSGAEIAPPEDVTGAGWAFTTNRFNAETGGGEAVHEEARRLARLLVTEIKLYNEEQVEAGRRNRNIYEVLREDIDRSRQIYEERIDDDVRTEADYFHDELVRILAAGESEILGL